MDKTITFTVNGQHQTVTTDPQRPLLDVLREDLQLTGTKYGCGEGQCGACTVLIDGQRMHACITPAGDADGKKIQTIEGLAKGPTLHPVQEAFLAETAFQCGYCTPGMIMSTIGLLAQKPDPTDVDIAAWMNGHICRCGAYPRILTAVRRAAQKPQG
ncbi:MAG: (2Fe-2S)-binding protein [Planctomycetota bacterium]|nr:(2Fe-2S)-binding protein [Planctomycetota bacterium]